MQTPVFNSHPMVPAMHLFQLPVMNAAWMDFYKSSVAATTSAQHSAPKKKGFNIADILSEEKPSETVMHMASHPYYPAVQQTSIPAHLPDRTGKAARLNLTEVSLCGCVLDGVSHYCKAIVMPVYIGIVIDVCHPRQAVMSLTRDNE